MWEGGVDLKEEGETEEEDVERGEEWEDKCEEKSSGLEVPDILPKPCLLARLGGFTPDWDEAAGPYLEVGGCTSTALLLRFCRSPTRLIGFGVGLGVFRLEESRASWIREFEEGGMYNPESCAEVEGGWGTEFDWVVFGLC